MAVQVLDLRRAQHVAVVLTVCVRGLLSGQGKCTLDRIAARHFFLKKTNNNNNNNKKHGTSASLCL
jgi:hypothetical protein